MLIGIEATRANKPTKTGVEWYAWHVIQELKKLTQQDGNSWILYSNQVLTGGLEVLPENWYEIRMKWPLPYGWTQVRLAYELRRRPIDVLWLPGSTLPRFVPKQTVVTVHDIGFHRMPKLYPPQQIRIHEHAMKEIKKKAARILTVSHYSGREIAEAYGIDPQKIAITPCGIDHSLYRPISDTGAIEERLRRYHISRPYFISVGRLETKKNITTLVKAFTSFKTRLGVGSPYALVLVGTPGSGYEEIKREISRSAFKSDIVETGYIPEGDMPYLLHAAEALVHPSWYEGFGIPPVQAMACGCPVISSNAASLPEILGEAARYFPPSEPAHLAEELHQLVDDTVLRDKMRADGIERAKRYTWTSTAEQTLPVLTRW
jgi:glycosyltransferase involved in cell wall biosynthesis